MLTCREAGSLPPVKEAQRIRNQLEKEATLLQRLTNPL